jgi:hypothetical protein
MNTALRPQDYAGHVPHDPARKLRCRVLDRYANRCPNEQLTDYGMCGKHLAGAAAEFTAITEQNRAARTLLTAITDAQATATATLAACRELGEGR